MSFRPLFPAQSDLLTLLGQMGSVIIARKENKGKSRLLSSLVFIGFDFRPEGMPD